MKTIWKFPLEMTDNPTISMPSGAEVLSVAVQGGAAQVWALVDEEAPTRDRAFKVHGTGHPAVDVVAGEFLGTVILHGGSLVFHIFDCGELAEVTN